MKRTRGYCSVRLACYLHAILSPVMHPYVGRRVEKTREKQVELAKMRHERLIASTLSIMTLFSLLSCLSQLVVIRT